MQNQPQLGAARELFDLASQDLVLAAAAPAPHQRFVAAQLAALRAGAAVVAVRAPGSKRGKAVNVWDLLAHEAPQLAEWAAFFQAGAARGQLVVSGFAIVSSREADDLLRDAVTFVQLVGDLFGFFVPGLAQVADRLVVSR